MFQRFAVMGHPIAHSLSPMIHALFAKQTGIDLSYEAIDVAEGGFESKVREFFLTGGQGLNITLPYKQRAFAMSDVASARCSEAKSANTLWMNQGQLYADNTDGVGFIADLSGYIIIEDKRILLLGAGGAARGIIGPLLQAKPLAMTLANRSLETTHDLHLKYPSLRCIALSALEAEALQAHYDIVIHATSGTLDGSSFPLSSQILHSHPFCYDLVYARGVPTPFVDWARQAGCVAVDGIGMLVRQAAHAFLIWHGIMPDVEAVLFHDELGIVGR